MPLTKKSVAAKISGWLLYFACVAGVIWVGWNEPFKYRFMSRTDISALETQVRAVSATPKPGAWMFSSSGRTLLDRGSYRADSGPGHTLLGRGAYQTDSRPATPSPNSFAPFR